MPTSDTIARDRNKLKREYYSKGYCSFEETSGFAYNLMFVNQSLAMARVNEIEATVVARTTVTASVRNVIAGLAKADSVARDVDDLTQFLWRTDKRHSRRLATHRKDNEVATTEVLTTRKFVHHHSVARPQSMADGSRHSVDGESKRADSNDKKHCYRKSNDKFYYLMLSTHLNRRFQRTPEKPFRSGSELHQMKIGLPTMWSSGTKPQ